MTSPNVLEGLQRMLRPLRQEWEMEFVESGAEALEVLAKAPVRCRDFGHADAGD